MNGKPLLVVFHGLAAGHNLQTFSVGVSARETIVELFSAILNFYRLFQFNVSKDRPENEPYSPLAYRGKRERKERERESSSNTFLIEENHSIGNGWILIFAPES